MMIHPPFIQFYLFRPCQSSISNADFSAVNELVQITRASPLASSNPSNSRIWFIWLAIIHVYKILKTYHDIVTKYIGCKYFAHTIFIDFSCCLDCSIGSLKETSRILKEDPNKLLPIKAKSAQDTSVAEQVVDSGVPGIIDSLMSKRYLYSCCSVAYLDLILSQNLKTDWAFTKSTSSMSMLADGNCCRSESLARLARPPLRHAMTICISGSCSKSLCMMP